MARSQPPVTFAEASEELSEILSRPDDAENRQRAYAAVSCIFEDVYQGVYWDAIKALDLADQVGLYTIAALGAPEYGFSTNWILWELVKLRDPGALPASVRWLAVPRSDVTNPQGATSCFIASVIGCAQHLSAPPAFGETPTDESRAWRAYGIILYWLNRPGLPIASVRERSLAAWGELLGNLAFHSIDPLQQFEHASILHGQGRDELVTALANAFPAELRRALEFGLQHHGRLSSLFRGSWGARDRVKFIIRWLAVVGDLHTIRLLEPLIDTPEVGREAVEAVRALQTPGLH